MRRWGSESSGPRCPFLLAAAVVVLLALGAMGCDLPAVVGDAGTLTTADSPSTAPQGATTTTRLSQAEGSTTTSAASATAKVRVYFSRDEKMAAASRAIPMTDQVGAAAMTALLQGPTAEEKAAGMVTCIPQGTSFLGLTLKNGVATVDLSAEYGSGGGSLSMFTRLAQVVFTLTQFSTVDGVRFKLDGKLIDTLGGEGIIVDKPLGRDDYEDMSPAILVESPTVGATAGSPLRVTGTANVFEAVFKIDIVNWDGLVIAQKTVKASSGTGTRGVFDVTVPFAVDKAGAGTLVVFSDSPKDGSHINVVEIPLHLAK